MTFEFGTPKSLDDISAEDVQAHPIWFWIWEAGLEGEVGDETWQCPVLDARDVTAAMTSPSITLRVKGHADVVASAEYDVRDDRLTGIAIWKADEWVDVRESSLSVPVTFIAVPTIRGVADVEFIFDRIDEDRALRVGS